MGEAQATATSVASRLGAFTIWDLRSTGGGASGLAFARASLDPSRSILAHAPPSRLDVDARSWETLPDRSAWTWSLELQGGAVRERDGDDHPDA